MARTDMGTVRRVWVVVGVVVGVVLGPGTPVGAEPGRQAGAGFDEAPTVRRGQLTVVAGCGPAGFSGDGGPAREARILAERISVGRDGSVYLSDGERVRRVTPDGVIDTVFSAGRDVASGDEVLVTAVAAGPDGSVYVTSEVDQYERQLLRVGRGGAATVLAAGSTLGAAPESGDDVAVDRAGNAFLYDADRKRVIRVDPSGRVAPVGKGPIDFEGAQIAVAPNGVVYLAEDTDEVASDGGLVYAIDRTGPRRTVAATGEGLPSGPAVAPDGTVYFIDPGRQQLMRINEDGTSVPVSVRLDGVGGDLAVGPDGDLYVTYGTGDTYRTGDPTDTTGQILRLVQHGERPAKPDAQKPGRSAWADDAPGTVHTLAGTGRRPPKARTPSGQDENASGIAVDGAGTVYVAEPARNQIRAIAPDGATRRFAGTGAPGETTGDYADDKADAVVLNNPTGVAAAPDGTVYLTANERLYRVDTGGKISMIEAPPQTEYGEGLDVPRLVATDPAGTLYYADHDSIQKLGRDGRPVVVVGANPETYAEETRPALRLLLQDPRWFAVGADGSVYFVEGDSDAVQVARPNGALARLTDGPGFAGDGGPATSALTNHTSGGAAGRDGSRYIADTYNNRVRRVDARGTITTVAGTGRYADTGDGAPATKAALTEPTDVELARDGTLFVLTSSDKVRAIEPNRTIRTLADLDPEPAHKATDTSFASLDSFTVGRDGTVYLASASGLYSTKPGGELRPAALDTPLPVFAKYGPTIPPRIEQLATGPDGSLYLVPDAALRAYPDGAVVPLLGGGMENRMADKPPEEWATPTEYTFREGDPQDIEIGSDGTLYLSTTHGLYSMDQDGKLDTVLKAEEYDIFGGVALDPDGRLYVINALDGVYRVVDGRREQVTRVGQPADIAFTSDGTMFASTGREIRRFSADGASTVVYQSAKSGVTELAVGPGDDLYFLEPDTDQVRVLVKAAQAPELSGPGSSTSTTLLVSIGGAILVLAGSVLIVRRARNRDRGARNRDRDTSEAADDAGDSG
jgi:hypothetical protein